MSVAAHDHQGPENYASANREHFDKHAHQADDLPGVQELARKITDAIKDSCTSSFDENSSTVLDYACGTGLISRGLVPNVKSIVGVDISQGMVDQYNQRVEKEVIPAHKMKAIRAELKGESSELDGAKFDLAICSMAFHHFSSISDHAKIISFFLKPGGSLVVIDIFKKDSPAGAHDPVVPAEFHRIAAHHDGFSESDMRAMFEGPAGLTQFEFSVKMDVSVMGHDMTLFLAKGSKPS